MLFDPPPYEPYVWRDGPVPKTGPPTPVDAVDLMAAEDSMVVGFQAGDQAVFTAVQAALESLGLTGASAPVNTSPPSITGSPLVGQPLTCNAGAWNSFLLLAGQMLRVNPSNGDTAVIAGATGTGTFTYTPTSADVGFELVLQVTATNGTTLSTVQTSSPTKPVAATTQSTTVSSSVIQFTTSAPTQSGSTGATVYSADFLASTLSNSTAPTGNYVYAQALLDQQFASPQAGWYRGLPVDTSCRLTGTNYFGQTEATLLAEFARQFTSGSNYPNINVNSYNLPIINVPSGQAKVKATLTQYGNVYPYAPNLQAKLNSAPIPPIAKASSGGDGGATFVDIADDTILEWYQGGNTNIDTPFFAGVYKISTSMGAYEVADRGETQGTSASGLHTTCGVITHAEFMAGRIHHMLCITTLGNTGSFVYPSWKRDGGGATGGNNMPNGTIMRFDPSLDMSTAAKAAALGLGYVAWMCALAIQANGMCFSDGGGSTSLVVENLDANNVGGGPSWYGSAGLYGNNTNPALPAASDDHAVMEQLFSSTMRSHLQVVDPAWLQSNHYFAAGGALGGT